MQRGHVQGSREHRYWSDNSARRKYSRELEGFVKEVITDVHPNTDGFGLHTGMQLSATGVTACMLLQVHIGHGGDDTTPPEGR